MSVFSTHWRQRLSALSGAILLAFTAAPSYAFTDDEARRAILELRQQIRQMNEQSQQAKLLLADQIEMMRQEIAQLRGKIEKLDWQSGQAQSQQSASPLISDPQEQAAYEAAMDLYRNGQYQEAASGFGTFIEAYPSSQQIDEVRFYEGSSLYATKRFSAAIQKLQTLISNSPTSERAPDALMVIASSQVEMNDLASAQKTLQRIVKEYPNSPAAETARNRLSLLQ